MTSDISTRRVERMAAAWIAALIVVVLIAQARLLYVFPQPDSARWWGDETGQMLELRTELQDGYARIPTALGSSVAVTNGLVRGNSWLATALYGVPALIFSRDADLVSIGRTVTFILSIGLLFLMYAMLKRNHVPRILALFALLLLVSTRSFFFASHAARLDVAAALAVLAFVWYLASRDDALMQARWKPTALWYFGYGVVAMLFATLSIHLLTLIGGISLYMLWRFRAFRNLAAIASAIAGVAIMLGILIGIYFVSGAPFSLFGPSSAPNQFQSVASGLPILRPFSRSVQVANILERLHGLWSEAPAILPLLLLAMIGIIWRPSMPKSNNQAWISGAAVVVAIAWLLFESPALYYYIQVLPLFIIAASIVIARSWKPGIVLFLSMIVLSMALCCFGVADTIRAGQMAGTIGRDNRVALLNALAIIHKDDSTSKAPIVLAQNPAIAMLEHDTNIRLMTAHFVSFPISREPLPNVLQKLDVQYLMLYAAHDHSKYSVDYHALRPIADSIGTVMLRVPGMLFDVDRDYFAPSTLSGHPAQDTLILYKLPTHDR